MNDDYLDAMWYAMWHQTMGRDPMWERTGRAEPASEESTVIELVEGEDGVWEMPDRPTREDFMRIITDYAEQQMREAMVHTPPTAFSVLNVAD